MKIFLFVTFLFYVLPSFSTVDGKDFYFKECVKCHRKDGKNGGIISDVAGKEIDHLVTELKKLRSGKRKAAIFAPIKKLMTDEQIELVSKYMNQM